LVFHAVGDWMTLATPGNEMACRQVRRRVVQVIDQRVFVRRLHIVDLGGGKEGATAFVGGGLFADRKLAFTASELKGRAIVKI